MDVLVLIHYRCQAGKEEDGLREISALVRTVVATEKDCRGITILRSEDDAAKILLYERWTSKEAYFGPHMETPHIRAFIERAPQFFAGPPEIGTWVEVG